MIGTFEIGSFMSAKVDKLSTGIKQRVAIARTMVHDPKALILDEPSSGLDVPGARLIVFSTHVMEEAEYLCDRIAVINQGKLKALGTMDELRDRTGKQRLREIFLDLLGLQNVRKEVSA